MPQPPSDALRQMAALAAREEQQAFAFRHPALFAPGVQLALDAELSNLPAPEAARLRPALDFLRAMLADIEGGRLTYQVGEGPFEVLLWRQARGEISTQYALALARQPEFAASLSPVYVRELTLRSMIAAQNGNWRPAVRMQRLVLEALGNTPEGPEAAALRRLVVLNWIDIVSSALNDVPDPRLYRRAVAEGERLLAEARKAEDRALVGDVCHGMGVLHLDPYTAGRSSQNYEIAMHLWRRRFLDEVGVEIAGIPEEERQMPTPEEALRKAEEYFREAAASREGGPKARSLKALVQTLVFQKAVNLKVDLDELVARAEEALALLEPGSTPHHELELMVALKRHGQTVEPERARRILDPLLASNFKGVVAADARAVMAHAVALLRDTDPFHCLELLRRVRPLFVQYGEESDRANYFNLMLSLFEDAYAPDLPSERPRGGLTAVAEGLRARAGGEKWDDERLGGALVSLAGRGPQWNDGIPALELLHEAARRAPHLAARYAASLSLLRGILLNGIGYNSVGAEQWPAAVRAYAAAISPFLDIRLRGHAMNCLGNIADVLTRHAGEPGLAKELVIGFAPVALRLETEAGDAAANALQRLYKWTLLSMAVTSVFTLPFFILMQLAKGLRFATALRRGADYDPASDAEGAEMLAQIDEAATALRLAGDAPAAEDAPVLDEDTLLTSYVRAGDVQSGDTPQERLTHLQQAFDAHLNAGILSGVPGGRAPELALDDLVTPEEIQSLLDDKTVLLNFYLGAAPNGSTAVYVALVTREDLSITLVSHNFPDSEVLLGDGERQLLANPFAPLVQQARRDVLTPSGPWPVSEEGGELFERDLRGFLGPFVEALDALQQSGKDHLCIVPHGPLHFYPLHLLGKPGEPLADKWKVSYLPNLRQLKRRAADADWPSRADGVAAFGISFTRFNPHDQAPLEHAPAGARGVAAVFGSEPILEEQATKEAVVEALRASRYVHISTHGRHNVNAPAFQCLYLAPGDDSDGRLFAHELLPLDLRGVELLTLSACETALGRFDPADNLRGLPASFLLAGVATIVGTLWEVEAEPADHFFNVLYTELKNGASRLEAFAAAQRSTRAGFDKYRQWGAFYLIGDWR